MDYRQTVKKLVGEKGQVKLVYYKALLQKEPMAAAMKVLPDNRRFFNIHRGERCFVIGNGPSLKSDDLSLLKDEQVFTVNYFNKMKDYQAAHTNYHFWVDSMFFNGRDDVHADMAEVMESYSAIAQEKCECFLPVSAYGFLKEKKLLPSIKPNFLYIDGMLANGQKLKMDLANIITPYTTVVQYAITAAIYMGFSEIYLLGCDSTYLMGLFHKLLEVKDDEMHAYRNDNSEKQVEEIIGKWSMPEILNDQYLLFLGYEKLYQYCKERGIKLVNCSRQTVVTSIPRASMEQVLREGK